MNGNKTIKGSVKKKLFEDNAGGLTIIFYRDSKPVAAAYGMEHTTDNGLDLLTHWDNYTNCAGASCGWADESGQSNDDITLEIIIGDIEKFNVQEVAKYDGYKITIYPDRAGTAAVKFIKS